MSNTTMLISTLDRSDAAAILGRKGGRAGVGASKRRSPTAIKRAVKARIKANRERKRIQEEKDAAGKE